MSARHLTRLTAPQQTLVLDHLPLADRLAGYLAKRQAQQTGRPYASLIDDQVSFTRETLCLAALAYDATRGVTFASFFTHRVRQADVDRTRHALAQKRCAPAPCDLADIDARASYAAHRRRQQREATQAALSALLRTLSVEEALVITRPYGAAERRRGSRLRQKLRQLA